MLKEIQTISRQISRQRDDVYLFVGLDVTPVSSSFRMDSPRHPNISLVMSIFKLWYLSVGHI